ETHKIASYLIGIDVLPYAILCSHAGTLPLSWYVYPQDTTNAKIDFANTADMIDYFSTTFHPYAFDKYGMAEAPFGGGMENQSMTVFGEYLIRGDKRYEGVVAHELAHQW